jgi:hypothetical protein
VSYPSTIVSRESLYTPVNNFAVSLTANVSASQPNLPISAKQIGVVQLPPSGLVSIGKEVIAYGAINPVGPQLINCIRGFDNTSASPHTAGEKVEVRWVAAHHNVLADLLYTIQVTLGADILNGSAQMGPATSYATLADKLTSTLPDLRAISPASTAWVVQHSKKRPVAVQLYEWDSMNMVFQSFEAPIQQTVDPVGPGMSVVTVEPFSVAKEGVVILL